MNMHCTFALAFTWEFMTLVLLFCSNELIDQGTLVSDEAAIASEIELQNLGSSQLPSDCRAG
jgi:hypothetical protein